jgi:23S rRNA pseudouridine955/2504/2580 synthase
VAVPVESVTVALGDGELRLDRWFRRHYPQLGHGALEKLLRTGQVRIDGKRARAGDRVSPGQTIRVPPLSEPPSEPAPRPVRPQDEALLRDAVLHRDDAVIVLNKPPGLAVQGGSGTELHLDRLLAALRFDADERPRLVHRLDKDTSGVLVLARSAAAAAFLAKSFRDNRVRKLYWAIVVGVPKPVAGRIDLALAKSPGRGGERVRADAGEGRRAVTLYQIVEQAGARVSWLALSPQTGRTHQLRAHCAALGTPILGDGKYGGAGAHVAGVPGSRQLHLHARTIELPHPAGGALRITAPLPPHMRRTWKFLGFADDAEDTFAGAGRRHQTLL